MWPFGKDKALLLTINTSISTLQNQERWQRKFISQMLKIRIMEKFRRIILPVLTLIKLKKPMIKHKEPS
jgi:hypothetical protein